MASFIMVSATLALLCGEASANGEFPHITSLSNGITVRTYYPADITGNMIRYDLDGRLVLEVPGGQVYQLIEDISDPMIVNKGDGEFHPFDADQVLEAAGGVDAGGAWMGMEVEIYILPMPRRFIQTSSTDGNRIFLSPGVREISYELAASTVTHEIGHCVQNHFMPDAGSALWTGYLSLRGIEDESVYSPAGDHMFRPAEIFAEDFRFLFGCDAARYSGTIENPYIALPGEVDGLEQYVVSMVSTVTAGPGPEASGTILAASNYPNPFNPSTTISVDIGAASEVPLDVNIYAVDGRLVRRLYSGLAGPGPLSLPWDGRGDGGRELSSGAYFYSIRSGTQRITGKMILVR